MKNGLIQKIKWFIILWLARRLPDCKRITKQLGESLDRKPTLRDRLVMKLHLFTCEACERYLEQVSFLKNAMGAHGECEHEAMELSELSREAKERIKSILRTTVSHAF